MSPIKEDKKEDEKKSKDFLENGKKPPKGGIEEVLKLGVKSGAKDGKSRFTGPAGQLNTIEEDLHET